MIRIAALSLALFISATAALADCLDPAMLEGSIAYNSSYDTMQYCRNTEWITFDGIGIGCNTGDGIVMSSSGWTCSPGGPP